MNNNIRMENKPSSGIKNALFLCLIFIGILIGVTFIAVTTFLLLKFPVDFIVNKVLIACIAVSCILTTIIKYKRSHKRFHGRYLFSCILLSAGIIGTILAAGGSIFTLIDIPSLVIVGIIPFLVASILCGFKNMVKAFSIQSINEPDTETLKKSRRFFEIYGKITIFSGIISIIIGIINMLSNPDEIVLIGPNVALALVSILYTCVIYILIIIPNIVFIRNKLDE
jgi:flagellar motor component MotA